MSRRFGLQGIVWVVLFSLILSGCLGGSSSTSQPSFKIDGVKDGEIYGHPVTPKVTPGPGSTIKKLTLNGSAFKSGTEIAQSGSYKLEVLVQNAKGASVTGVLSFTLLLEAPVIAVTGVEDGGYYLEPVTPQAATQDATDTISATLNGENYTLGTPIEGPGEYSLIVTATNIAGKSSTVIIDFEIGVPPTGAVPTFQVEGVEDGAIYDRPVTPVIILGEGTFLKTLTLNGDPYESGTEIAAPNTYLLEIRVQNEDGVTAHGELQFSIVIPPPVIIVTGVADGGYYTKPVTPVVKTDNETDSITATLNNTDYTLGTSIAGIRQYELTITATNEAGIASTLTIHFEIGEPVRTGPAQPGGLSATLGRKCVIVRWDHDLDVTGYMVFRSSDEFGTDRTPLLDSLLDGSVYEDYDVREGLVYWYWVQAYADEKASILSDPVASPPVSFDLRVPDQYGTIQEAIDAAEDGDTVTVAPGRYAENLQLRGKNIILKSTDPTDADIVAATIIDGSGKDAVIRIYEGETDAVITGFTIVNGIGAARPTGDRRGGGIDIFVNSPGSFQFSITNNVFQGNEADYGGGLSAYMNSSDGCILTIAGNTFRDNRAQYGGGIYTEGGTPVITDNTVSDNSALDGGGVYVSADQQGVIEANTVVENTAVTSGGGLFVNWGYADIVGNTIMYNTSTRGGGLCALNGSNSITDNTISHNTSSGNGGGLYAGGGSQTITLNRILGNRALGSDGEASGGGLYVTAYAESHSVGVSTISENQIEDNLATDKGGGLYLLALEYHLTSNTISRNSAPVGGGAYVEWSEFNADPYTVNTMTDNLISDNTSSSYGGGMYMQGGRCQILRNTVSGNRSDHDGGGLYLTRSGQAYLLVQAFFELRENSFISNKASWGHGGAVWVSEHARVRDAHDQDLPIPDGQFNDYQGNQPDDIYYEFQDRLPVIDVIGVEDGGYYTEPVTPQITTQSDRDTITAVLNGLPYTLGAPITDHNEYTLEIIATNFAGKQAYLTVSFRIGAPLPAQPTGLSAVLGRNCVQLSWDESSDAHGYIVYRGSDQSGNDRLCLADHLVGEVSYEDYDVGEGEVYWYWVQAYNINGWPGPISAPVQSPEVILGGLTLLVPDHYGRIQEAIDASEDGDCIIVSRGRYQENLDLSGKSITIRSTQPEDPHTVAATIIDGGENDAVITVDGPASVTISGFTITNGIGHYTKGERRGGGICIYGDGGNQVISHNRIVANTADFGGGIYIEKSAVTISHNSIMENSTTEAGGGLHLENLEQSTIENNIITGNSAQGFAGGLLVEGGYHTMVGNLVSENSCYSYGGGIYLKTTHCLIEENRIIGNLTTGGNSRGGGVHVLYGSHHFEKNEVSDNHSTGGGGLFFDGSYSTLTDNDIHQNSASSGGGGIKIRNGNLDIVGNRITGNTALAGGGLHTYAEHGFENIIADNIVTHNTAMTSGGGLLVASGTHTITGNTFDANSAEKGGGVLVDGYGRKTIGSNVISGNQASNGGGLYVFRTIVELVDNKFWENMADTTGGAAWISAGSELKDDWDRPLTAPHSRNEFVNNSPNDIYYQP